MPFCPFNDMPVAYGGSQAKGLIRAVAASLHQNHSNARSETSLKTTPELMAMPDPQPTEQGQGSNRNLMVPSSIRFRCAKMGTHFFCNFLNWVIFKYYFFKN